VGYIPAKPIRRVWQTIIIVIRRKSYEVA